MLTINLIYVHIPDIYYISFLYNKTSMKYLETSAVVMHRRSLRETSSRGVFLMVAQRDLENV